MFVSSLAEIGSGKEMDKQKEVGINDIVTFVLINWAPYAKYERLMVFFLYKIMNQTLEVKKTRNVS